MASVTSAIYAEYFKTVQDGSAKNWEPFKTTREDEKSFFFKRPIDFSIQIHETRKKTNKIAEYLFIGIYKLARYITQRLIMMFLYPAQNPMIQNALNLSSAALDQERLKAIEGLNSRGYIVRHIVLEKQHTLYSGLLIGHPKTILNGKWALHAVGNCQAIEQVAGECAEFYHEQEYNTLLINGPSVGKSGGTAKPINMGDAQEIGLTFLEEAIKADKIILSGYSLGRAALASAILTHCFKIQRIKYMVISQMAFDSVSHIAAAKTSTFAQTLVRWSGCEIDIVASSKRLAEFGIKEFVIQSTKEECDGDVFIPELNDFCNDGILPPQTTLGYNLIQNGITENKVFIGVQTTHKDWLSLAMIPHIQKFIAD